VSDTYRGELIALYGSLLRGLGAMQEIGVGNRLRFVGPCLIEGQLFDLGAYPGLRRGTGLVVGEIYALLDSEALKTLDRFEDFEPAQPQGSLYQRERVSLIEPADTEAWIYFYNQVPDASQQIESGDWRAHLAARADG
jgi:gamma-glutamylcyclotransferase (GGCT)/AIG2-like uncharacterized protein YtfP